MEGTSAGPVVAASAPDAVSPGGRKPVSPKRPWQRQLLLGLLIFGFGLACDYGLETIWRSEHRRMMSPEYLVSSYPVQPTSAARSDAIAYTNRIAGIMQPCNGAISYQYDAEGGTDKVAQYQAAQNTQAKCHVDDSDAPDALAVPRSVGHDAALIMSRASFACSAALSFGELSAFSLKSGLDHKGDLAQLAESRNEELRWEQYRAVCRERMLQATTHFGVKAGDIHI